MLSLALFVFLSLTLADILLVSSKGIGAFVLNNSNSNFKLFLSFDVSSLPCATHAAATVIRDYLTAYRSHPHQLIYPPDTDHLLAKGEASLPSVYFLPSFFTDPATFGAMQIMDMMFQWNWAWPMGGYTVNYGADEVYIENLGGRTYMASVSPWFFTFKTRDTGHYEHETYDKNFIRRCDDWHFAARWEMTVKNRNAMDLAEVITCNDFGALQSLYPETANAPDHVGKPQNYVFRRSFCRLLSATVVLSCGSTSSKSILPAKLSKLRLRLWSDCDVEVKLWRNTVLSLSSPRYNFNPFVTASP
ncbi:glycoside hydrolase family 71 protein [Lyophyllum atratum]|nr:glycoside hydrolase family 71 protein [Lyophyllum atratum]